MAPFGRGENGHEKTPSVAGGVPRVRSMRLNQRARPPGTPPVGVVVVVTVRPIPLMPGISRPSRAPSSHLHARNRLNITQRSARARIHERGYRPAETTALRKPRSYV